MTPTLPRRFTILPAAAAAALAAGPSWAADPAPAPRPSVDIQTEWRRDAADAVRHLAQLGDETLSWVSREVRQERIVKGAPYCADAVHETVQPLTDGNRIVQRQTTRLCRDGEGRTRQEVSARDGRRTVYLRDPVAKENWVLDPERKTARSGSRVAFGAGVGEELHLDTGVWRDYGERMREWAREMADRAREAVRSGKPAGPTPGAAPVPPVLAVPPAAQPTPPAQPAPVVISRHETTAGEGGRTQRQVEVQVMRIQDGAVPPPLPGLDAPPAVRLNARALAPRGPGVVTALPAKEIDGLKVHGERTTWTIEAGQVGNEKPIVITREVWTSPELMLTVQTRDVDPRSGEVQYRLQNLKRSEPDPALFKVPADYTVRPRTSSPGVPGAPSAPARG